MSTGNRTLLARLFFALWPNEATRAALVATRSGLTDIRANWIRPEKLHITLAFLGQVEVERISDIYAAAEDIDCQGFALDLDRLEVWRRTQVLCMTPSTPSAGIIELVSRLSEALRHNGLKPDSRPFRPHLTLARRVKTRPLLPPPEIEPVHWSTSSFCLVESRQGWRGSEYAIHKTWSLK